LPQPFGPVIIQFIPGLISIEILSTSLSPLGDIIGTSSNLIKSLSYISPFDSYILFSFSIALGSFG